MRRQGNSARQRRSSTDFLRRLHLAAPMKITKLLTDNGGQFTDRFTTRKRIPSGQHVFDKACPALQIEHRLAPPRHPQTNGMIERFNGRISGIVGQTRFASAAELESTLQHCAPTYNNSIPQRARHHRSPIQALKSWQVERPDLFVKRVHAQTGLDVRVGCLDRLHPGREPFADHQGGAGGDPGMNTAI